ncbi:MAG: hypothetical protein E7364_05485 [Clostridiales bacterium]|nr:hypothetical protein [Clostridiales bacterium]
MNLKKLLKGIFAVLVCSLSIIALGKLNPQSVKAETALTFDSFSMENGAAVRIKTLTNDQGEAVESNGLRFSAEISASEYDALKNAGARFGVVIVAKDLLKSVEINEETVFGANPSFYFSNETNGDGSKISMLHVSSAACENIDKDENIEICGSLVNILLNNFTRSFIGRVYVAIPQTNESGELTYSYHFAPYYEGNIANNTRCIYYVAQRAQEEESEHASFLQENYIVPFSQTDRFKNYQYRYYVNHHYIDHNGDGTHVVVHTERTEHYAPLNSQVTALPIEKPAGIPALEGLNFVFDIDESKPTESGRVYAAGMQTLDLYYENSKTISEEHKADTLAALVANFLNPDNASHNFGVKMTADGGVWEADKVIDENTKQQIGISLHATKDPNKNRTIILSKAFFEDLRAFGVTSMTFDFHTPAGDNNKIKYNVYQEELIDGELTRLPVYDQLGNKITNQVTEHKITVYLEDITRGGGVSIELDPSASDKDGNYHFGSINFGFEAKPVA